MIRAGQGVLARLRAVKRSGSGGTRWKRGVVLVLMAALVLPLFGWIGTAAAEDKPDDYSLYKLASNAGAYFSNANSPDSDRKLDTEAWGSVLKDPSSAGSLIGYADPDFSFSLDWLSSRVSGSSQTYGYDVFTSNGDYSGLADYAHFGAALSDLGLDSMSSGLGSGMIHTISGGIIWLGYVMAMGVSLLFWTVIQALKVINPFGWFKAAVAATAGSDFAEGMGTGGSSTNILFSGVRGFISQWYGVLVDMSWTVLVPLFLGFFLLGLVLFKKMDRGGALKKLAIRIVFIGVGLPLIGGMYTSILDQFSDRLFDGGAGPTRVVLSTYVDFNQWAMQDRLAVPGGAVIGWKDGNASPAAQLNARRTALAINAQSYSVFKAFAPTDSQIGDATTAWQQGSASTGSGDSRGSSIQTAMGMLQRYIGSTTVSGSDFESGVKADITNKVNAGTIKQNDAKNWFLGDNGRYGDSRNFGDKGDPAPQAHPLISTAGQGLQVKDGVFTTPSGSAGCGFAASTDKGDPKACNLSPLATYNYLNTGFHADSLTLYSSDKATSGFTRENHASVSQVGTGPAGFMYWLNAVVLLGSIVLVGLWYGVGMLVGSVKRTFGVVAAIPFATLGALASISKVIIYSVAMILEVLVTLFLYSFVSEFLVSLPQIIEGPIATLITGGGVLSSPILGTALVVVMTVFSTMLILGVTIALLKARKSVIQALNEAVTKLVDKFMGTNNTPPAGGGGALPAMAGGLGAGAANAAMMNRMGGNAGGGAPGGPQKVGVKANTSAAAPGGAGPKQGGMNASGTNGAGMAMASPVASGAGTAALTAGPGGSGAEGSDGDGMPGGGSGAPGTPGSDGGGNAGGNGVDGSTGTDGTDGSSGSGAAGLRARGSSAAADAPDTGTPTAASSTADRSQGDRMLAKEVAGQGGLTQLGVSTSGKPSAGAKATGGRIDGSAAGTEAKKPTAGAGVTSSSSGSGTTKPKVGAGSGGTAPVKNLSGTATGKPADPNARRAKAGQGAPAAGASGAAAPKRVATSPARPASQPQRPAAGTGAQARPARASAPVQRGTVTSAPAKSGGTAGGSSGRAPATRQAPTVQQNQTARKAAQMAARKATAQRLAQQAAQQAALQAQQTAAIKAAERRAEKRR